jgi:hypothetical protein
MVRSSLSVLDSIVICLVFLSGESEDEINYLTSVFSLRVALVHEASQVRAAALRAVRYLLKEEKDVRILNKLRYPCLISRYVNCPYGVSLIFSCHGKTAA